MLLHVPYSLVTWLLYPLKTSHKSLIGHTILPPPQTTLDLAIAFVAGESFFRVVDQPYTTLFLVVLIV